MTCWRFECSRTSKTAQRACMEAVPGWSRLGWGLVEYCHLQRRTNCWTHWSHEGRTLNLERHSRVLLLQQFAVKCWLDQEQLENLCDFWGDGVLLQLEGGWLRSLFALIFCSTSEKERTWRTKRSRRALCRYRSAFLFAPCAVPGSQRRWRMKEIV